MSKPPISFRLSDREWEVLKEAQQERESINQTAARLLRERLGTPSVDLESTLESTILGDWISELISLKLESTQWTFKNIAFEEVERINQRLDLIETKLPKPRTRKSVVG